MHSQMTILSTIILILMHFNLNIFAFGSVLLCTHLATSAFRNVKPNVSQSEATFYNDVGFATVYCTIF